LPCHCAVTRLPASDLAPDNDLGGILVTQGVGELTSDEIVAALDAGVAVAESLLPAGLIRAAALQLQGQTRIVGVDPSSPGGAVELSAGRKPWVDARDDRVLEGRPSIYA
jgi:hypothetical protein